MTIAHTTFDGNSASDAGGLFNDTGGTATITKTTFLRNCGGTGGGLWNRGAESTVSLTDTTIEENVGGGVGAGIATTGTAILINTTLARNRQRALQGGGLSNASGTVIFINSTIAENTSETGIGLGEGIANGGPLGPPGTVTLTNTILARNSLSFGGRDCSGPVTSLGNNLIGDPTGCTITLQPTDLTGDPGLDAFTDNGTPGNGHFPLLPGSPAINAGNDAFCPPTDQLGEPRMGPCDIGAIEFQGKHHKRH